MQNVWALEFIGRGEKTVMAPAADVKLAESPCIKCGQCSAHCPVGAIYEKDETAEVWAALRDEEKTCLVQIAPAVRVALGEAFGMKPGELSTGKIYAALRRLGFDKVFDTNFSADVTIMEEGTEFIKRFTTGGKLPLITSCCPAWTDWMEKYAPDFTENFSSAKSPQQMLSALAKSYWAEKNGVDGKKVHVTSIMPCTAKKFEISRDKSMSSTGDQDTDVVITTRELARMIKAAGIDFLSLPDEAADDLLGSYTGAGTIFGVTGGVMEAALRTAYCLITKEAEPPAIEFSAVRGMEGVKKATIDIKGTAVNIAVAHQMGNVEKVLNEVREDIKNGVKPRYDFIEVMACRGGCVGGGGQPCLATDEVRAQRTAGLYTDDEKSTLRMSHLNPEVQSLYKDYLGEPGSEKAEHLLHTHYHKREVYQFTK
jgi:NADH-quinone oxidoreductase subunit G